MARRAVHPVDSFELAKWRLASTRIDGGKTHGILRAIGAIGSTDR